MTQGVCVKNDALIMRMTSDGKTAKEIAVAIGAAEDSVKRYRRTHGYKKPKKGEQYKKKKRELDGDKIICLIRQRMTYAEIANEIECSEYRVKYFCKKTAFKASQQSFQKKERNTYGLICFLA